MKKLVCLFGFLLILWLGLTPANSNPCSSNCESWLTDGTQECKQFVQEALQKCSQIGSQYEWVAPGTFGFGSCSNYPGGVTVPTEIGAGTIHYEDRQQCEQAYSYVDDPCGQAANTIRNALEQTTCNLCSNPAYPYYNANDNTCHQTPCFDPATPYYNSGDKQCYQTPCFEPAYPYYNASDNTCRQTPCFDPATPFYNNSDNKCYPTPCFDPARPYYNSDDKQCHPTPCFDPAYPYYNASDKLCYSSNPNSPNPLCADPATPYYNASDKQCYPTPCPDPAFPYYNASEKLCYSSNPNIPNQLCTDPATPYYNASDKKCYPTLCFNPAYPYYNASDKLCYASNPNTSNDPITPACADPAYPYYNAADGFCYPNNPDNPNKLFIINPGSNREAKIADTVTLSAQIKTGSLAGKARIKKAKYRWKQVSGPQAILKGGATAAKRTFVARSAGTYTFSIAAYDSQGEGDLAMVAIAVNPKIVINTPMTGDFLTLGSFSTVRWAITGIAPASKLAISLSTDAGVTYKPLKTVKAGAGSYKFKPNKISPTDHARLSICLPKSAKNDSVCGTTFGEFSIH